MISAGAPENEYEGQVIKIIKILPENVESLADEIHKTFISSFDLETADAIGNIASTSDQGTYTYGGILYANPHAVTRITTGLATTTLGYDNNGNATSSNTYKYTWNYRNRLTQAANGLATSSYRYDYTNNRIYNNDGTTQIHYADKYHIKPTGQSTTTINIFIGDLLVGTMDNKNSTSIITYIFPDHLGSTQVTTDVNSTIQETVDYYPYGATRVDSWTASTSRQFIGQYFDAQPRLSYLNARYYNGDRGQFLSQDPVFWSSKQNLVNPQSLNSYSYANDNPIVGKDPLGLFNIQTGAVEKGDTLGGITKLLNTTFSTNNSVSTVANLNSIKNPNLIRVGQTIIPNQKVPDISTSLRSTLQSNADNSSINGVLGPINFFNNVKTGGPWDYKNQPGQYSSQTHTAFVFDGKMVSNDFPGNVNYGYTGISTWWGTPGLLLSGAGGAQVVTNAKSANFSSLLNPPYFDNPGDSGQIKQGIQLYKNSK